MSCVAPRREIGQNASSELSVRDLKAELLAREQQHFEAVRREKGKVTGLLADAAPSTTPQPSAALIADEPAPTKKDGKPEEDILAEFDDADDSDDASVSSSSRHACPALPRPLTPASPACLHCGFQ